MVSENHFEASEHQNRRKALVQKAHSPQNFCQHEINRTKTEHRENIRGTRDKGIARDREYGWNRVRCENHIHGFDRNQGQKERCNNPASVFAHDKMLAVVLFGHRKDAAREAYDPRRLGGVVGTGNQHARCRYEQDRAKNVGDRLELIEQRDACENEPDTQCQRADDAVIQDPVLRRRSDAERAKDYEKKKDVVDAEAFFDQVAGEKFYRRLASLDVKHAEVEKERQRDPRECFNERGAWGRGEFAPAVEQDVDSSPSGGHHGKDKPEQGSGFAHQMWMCCVPPATRGID